MRRLPAPPAALLRLAARLLAAAIVAILAGLPARPAWADAPETAAAPDAEQPTRVYIVQLRQAPAIDVAAASRRVGGDRFDPRSAAVSGYGAALVDSQDRLLAEIGAPDAKLYSYRLAFNGFAARLTAAQAAKLRAHPAVKRVWEDRVKSLKTNASGQFLGLLDPASGLRGARGLTGENVVIGIIDSGITPDHPSFLDQEPKPKPRICRGSWADDSLLGAWLCHRFKKPRYRATYAPPQNWLGRCQAGPGFPASACNNKIIGARFYADGFRESPDYVMDPGEFLSPLDADGHGTHIASVAAGGRVTAAIGGTTLAPISGMAPRARIAVYKACWLQAGATRATCAMSDLQRAIEDAVADGVDIINYSVGTADGGPGDPDALALLAAADAGVLTVASAGNGGPAPASVESPGSSPWVLTTAASSRSGTRYDEVLRVTGPATAAGDFVLKEAGFTPTLQETGAVSGRLLLAHGTASTEPDGSPADACGELDNAAELAGRIALVRRGACNFQVKVANAETAGATAVVVFGNDADAGAPITMTGERGSVGIPAVMIGQAAGEFLATRLGAGDAVQVTLQKGLIDATQATGNQIHAQSARGPNPNVFDILKPDVTAPGVEILGAQTPDVANGVRGEWYQYLSGTSMAVPHVAGVAALLRQAHPRWSPAALRSALMTTARQDLVKEDGASPADAFDFGAGHIVPNLAVDPGLVYETDRDDYDAFGCGVGLPGTDEERCAALTGAGYSTAPDDLNLPSIASSAVVHARTVHRRVTNVGAAAVYQASVEAPAGIAVDVSPASLALASGESADYTVTFTNTGAARRVDYASDAAVLPDFRFGALTWTGAGHAVRSPLAVAPAALAAPGSVAGHEAEGEAVIPVDFGYTGDYAARVSGLVAPVSYTGEIIEDPLPQATDIRRWLAMTDDAQLPDFFRRHRITVPAGTRYLRVALGSGSVPDPDDLVLYLQCPGGSCPGGYTALASGTEGSSEVIEIADPVPGEYLVDAYRFPRGEVLTGQAEDYEVGVWMVADGPGLGGLAVTGAPAAATLGGSGEVTLGWSGLDAGELYLGLVTHGDGEHDLAVTLVEIATP